MTNDQMRDAFERYMREYVGCSPHFLRRNEYGSYTGKRAFDAWEDWQAAYAAGMERAAGICDAREAENQAEWGPFNDREAHACADAIRAEIPKGGNE